MMQYEKGLSRKGWPLLVLMGIGCGADSETYQIGIICGLARVKDRTEPKALFRRSSALF